ncbi:MAG: hypothetical protein ACYTBV_00255 [Planctomycetota bacterium]|jgi:hypothetical protein
MASIIIMSGTQTEFYPEATRTANLRIDSPINPSITVGYDAFFG